MRLLDRYLLRELLVPLGYCLAGFLMFWVSSDLVNQIDEYQAAKLSGLDVARYYLLRLPELLPVVMPVALLLALLYTLTHLARSNELTAMRAAGQSLWRLTLPYFIVGLAFSLMVFYCNETLAPVASEIADQMVKRAPATNRTPGPRMATNLNFRNEIADRFWRIGGFDLDTFEMRDPFVDWTAADGSRRQLVARRAERVDGAWVFEDVRMFILRPGIDLEPRQEVTNRIVLPEFEETPDQIRSEIKINQLGMISTARKARLSVGEIIHYKSLHPNLHGEKRALILTTLYSRLAAPWTCLIVVFIAVPFGAPSGRRNVFVGVASSIFICFGFFLVQEFSSAAGIGGYLPPVIAAWLPNLLFGSFGLWMTARVR
jgi:lipopolysaccharide export system permease protein